MTVHGRLSAGEVTSITIVDGLVDSPSAARLVGELVTALAAHHPAADFTVLQRAERSAEWPAELADRVRQLTPDGGGDWLVWAGKQLAAAECVWTLGLRASQKVPGALPKQALLHAMLLDEPERDPRFLPGHHGWLTAIAKRASLVWFHDEGARSAAEAVAPILCERTRVFAPSSVELVRPAATGQVRLVQPAACFTQTAAGLFATLADDLLSSAKPLHMQLAATEEQIRARAKTLDKVPLLPWRRTAEEHDKDAIAFALVDDSRNDGLLWGPALSAAAQLGAVAIPLSKVAPDLLLRALFGEGSEELLPLAVLTAPEPVEPSLAELLPPTPAAQLDEVDRTRVVLAGTDLKFAASMVSAFANDPTVELLIDSISDKDTGSDRSEQLAEWADVVVCEFMTVGAVWYSNHLPEGRKLIVHLHGFELWAALTDEVNISRVDSIVVASEFYKRTAIDHRGWPEDKVLVVPNSIATTDLARPKDPDARFQLGLVGWVPSLKRPDRALDLLEELLRHDKRYYLTLRGALPWNYSWEWKKPTHQDSYYQVLERLSASPELAEHVTFVPFGADVGNWLRSVGWMLSTSVRETFHLAPVEGMASGAVPVVWDRDGADEIFTDEFVVADHHEAARRILQINETDEGFPRAQQRAQALASSRYAQEEVERRWLQLVAGYHAPRKIPNPIFEDAPGFIQDSVELVVRGDFDGAVDILDQNISQTANATGFVKQHELFVRGVQELRFRLLREGIRSPRRAADQLSGSFLLVQVPNVERAVPADMWGASATVLMAPPPGDPRAKTFNNRQFSAFAPIIPTLGIDPTKLARFDRYLEVVTAQLMHEALACGVRDIVVDGPLWNVLAALQVAQSLGGEVWWDLSQAESSDWTWLRQSPGLLTDDPAECISAFVTGSVAGVVVRPDHVPTPLLSMLPPERLVSREQLLHRHPEVTPPAREARRVTPLVVAALVTDELAACLAAHPEVELHRVSVEELDALDASTDVCLVDTDQFLGTVTTKVVMDAFDRMRGRGVRSVVIESQGALPFGKLTGYYARADVFAARSANSLEAQAGRTMQAVTQLFELPSDGAVAGLGSLERVLGIAVNSVQGLETGGEGEPPSGESLPAGVSAAPAAEAAERLQDRVSVVMPAYRTDGSVFVALESICQQTLAPERIEIVLVANGPGVQELPKVREFAAQHPGYHWVIMESEPGASRARNVALDHASGDYVTFLDDDDWWEPNHLAAMMAVAAPDTVVVSEIIDADGTGSVQRNTASRRRLLFLGLEKPLARSHPGLFAAMGGRLIPRQAIGERRFDEQLGSGEDIAFLGSLLNNGTTYVAGAYEMSERAYIRIHTGGSVSRPERADLRWGIEDRLGVLRQLWQAAEGEGAPEDGHGYSIRAILGDPQTMFMERHLANCPEHLDEAKSRLSEEETGLLEFMALSARGRAPIMVELLREVLDARREAEAEAMAEPGEASASL